jgi:hypothetical protein
MKRGYFKEIKRMLPSKKKEHPTIAETTWGRPQECKPKNNKTGKEYLTQAQEVIYSYIIKQTPYQKYFKQKFTLLAGMISRRVR